MRLKTNKQERRQMKPNGAEGRAAVYRMSPATNDEFNGLVNGRARLARPQAGWDPHEVWRTRVKASSTVMQGREREPLRYWVRLALRVWRLRTTLEGIGLRQSKLVRSAARSNRLTETPEAEL
jgi:hypothetical protein